MDATTGATIVASVINSSSLNCSSSSSSNSSSGYGSSQSAASTPIGSQYEATAHTPVSAASEHVPPTATVAPVTPCYSETALSQQQRQQYYQSYAYPNSASQYPIYDAFTGNSYHNLTTPSIERSLGHGSSYHIGSSSSISGTNGGNHLNSQQQRTEKSSKITTSSSGTLLHTSSATASSTTTTSASTKPQAAATPFFAQPSSNVSSSNSAYYDAYNKYKMPSSSKLSSHAATDYHFQHAVASLSYQHQQQHYYAAAKSQLQDANYAAAVKPHRQHSVNNATAYYGNSGAYYDKYIYPSTASGAAYGTAAPTHATHPYSPHEPTTSDPYRKAAAAAAANWQWNMEYAASNCRTLAPTAAGSSYLTTGSATSSGRDAFCAATNDKYSKYEKHSAYYASAHPQQYITPQSSATSSRNLWSNATHPTPHLASVQHGLNERLTHTLPPSASQHQYTHTYPHASHHHFASASTAAATAQRQSCCAQPYQQQSCYYPRPSQQHAHTNTTNPYAPPQQNHYNSGSTSAMASGHKYGAYSSTFKSNSSSNDLFATSPFDNPPPPAYNYSTAAAASLQPRYGTSNAAFYNDLSMQTAFDGFASTAPMLQQHNVPSHATHLGYQMHTSSQNPSTSALLDYRKPTASASNDYCLGKSRAPPLTALEQHIGPAGFFTFDIHGNPIAQAHSVITSPTIYSDGGSSSEKSTPTTKNIRDFLATWSEGEDEESAAAATAAEQLSFVEGAPVQLQNRTFGLPELGSSPDDRHAHKHAPLGARPKIHVGITVDGSIDVDSSQFINLPDIVIDIEKPNAATPANGATTPAETATNLAITRTATTTLVEQHSPCGDHSHEIFENFDVEKELDELQIKRAKLCLEKQLNNEIRILTPEPGESQSCEVATKHHDQQTMQYQNITAVHHGECEKSYERGETAIKEMELNDSTSHSSNGSTFEKEYETFINRIENDKTDVERQHKTCHETDPSTTHLPIINEDSGSVSHQSSGIKTPPDPADIDDLAQRACQSVKPLNFSGNPDFETGTHEDFSDCVQDLTTYASIESSQKSMDDSMVLQNFEGPSEELVVMSEKCTSAAAEANVSETCKELNEKVIDETSNSVQPEDLSLSRDGLAEEKGENSKSCEGALATETLAKQGAAGIESFENTEDFSVFYKKKRKLVHECQDNDNVQIPNKQSKIIENTATPKEGETVLEAQSNPVSCSVGKNNQEAGKKKKIAKNKRRPLSFFYKNLRHWTNARKVKMQALVQQQLSLLKERHLPLIKRQSIKNFSNCDKLVFNPSSLKCLTVSIVNTDEFQHHILENTPKEPKSPKGNVDESVTVKKAEGVIEVNIVANSAIAGKSDENVNNAEEPTLAGNKSEDITDELCNQERSSQETEEDITVVNEEDNLSHESVDDAAVDKEIQAEENTENGATIVAEQSNGDSAEDTVTNAELPAAEKSFEAFNENTTAQTEMLAEENLSEASHHNAEDQDKSVESVESVHHSEPSDTCSEEPNDENCSEARAIRDTTPDYFDDRVVVYPPQNIESQSLSHAVTAEQNQQNDSTSCFDFDEDKHLKLKGAYDDFNENQKQTKTLEQDNNTEFQAIGQVVMSTKSDINEPVHQGILQLTTKANEANNAEHHEVEAAPLKTTEVEAKTKSTENDEAFPLETNEVEAVHLKTNKNEINKATLIPQANQNSAPITPEMKQQQAAFKEDILKDALEEQSSTTLSDNWSSSLKAQEDFNGFENESSAKETFNTNSNSLESTAEVAKSKHMERNEVQATSTEMESSEKAKAAPVVEVECLCQEAAEPVHNETDLTKQPEAQSRQVDSTEPADIVILDSDSEPEIISESRPKPMIAADTATSMLTTQTNLASSGNNEQSTPLPPMRTKASVKMCDFSAIRLKRQLYQERKKSKGLDATKVNTKDKVTQKQTAETSTNQKPSFKGIGKIDKTKFVENWAASITNTANKTKLKSEEQKCSKREVSTEALDLSPKTQSSSKASPVFDLDESSNSSSSSTSTSSSSDSSCESKSQASSSSSQTKTSTTSSTSQSSSSDSSSSGSDFNELKALERELSQHKTHNDWANSVAEMCEAENGDATKTDKIKLELFETEATNQDIANLKKILESEENTSEHLMPDMENEVCTKTAEVCEKGEVANQATKFKKSDKFSENQATSSTLKQQQEDIVIPKLSDLCNFALNSSFVINDINVKHNNVKEKVEEKEKEKLEQAENQHHQKHDNHITPPSAPKSINLIEPKDTTENQQHKIELQQQPQPARTVEEELAEMYRQAGVASDPEDNIDEGLVAGGENYTENHAQDYLLINLAEILANTDNESNFFVLQCDMNENVLRVMTTSPRGDNGNELVIGEVANVDVESSSAVQIVQLVNAENVQVAAPPLPLQPAPLTPSPPPPPPSLTDDDITTNTTASPAENYTVDSDDCNNDFPIIHHEEIVPDNYKKYQKEQFLKYLHEKYVQKHVKRFYHAHRISKKYRQRYLSKKVSNSLVAAAVVAAPATGSRSENI